MNELVVAKDEFSIKKRTVLRVLREEQIYDYDYMAMNFDQLDKNEIKKRMKKAQSYSTNSTNKQPEANNNNSNSKSEKESIRLQKRNRIRAQNKLKVFFGGLDFGASKQAFKLILILAVLICVQYCYFEVWRPMLRRIVNFCEVYILGIETWNAMFTIHTAFLQTVLWNNTVPFWGTTSLEVFDLSKAHFMENVFNNYTRAMSYDLGNYTDKFVTGYTKVKNSKNF